MNNYRPAVGDLITTESGNIVLCVDRISIFVTHFYADVVKKSPLYDDVFIVRTFIEYNRITSVQHA